MKTKLLISIVVLCVLLTIAGIIHACGGGGGPTGTPPVAIFTPEPNTVTIGSSILFNGSQSYDPDEDGFIVSYHFDFHYESGTSDEEYSEWDDDYPDGAFDGNTPYTYEYPGTYTAALKVGDNGGHYDTDTCTVYVQGVNNTTQNKWYLTIQEAIDDANNGDTIKVHKGTYYENIDFKGRAVTLTGTDPNDWDTVSSTIISADGNDTVVTFDTGEDANSILTGITIRGGWGNNGGGIYCNGTSPTIKKCLIRGNSADNGGGIYDCNSSSPTVQNCFFVANDANSGGAVYDVNSSPYFENCVFTDNVADVNGAGTYNNQSSPIFINCTFRGNSAEDGGGMYSYGSSSEPNVVNCIFWDNDANNSGDEIYNVSSADPNFKYSDIEGSGGSDNWDPNFGSDDGNNIDQDPLFAEWSSERGIISGWMVSHWKFDEGSGSTAYDTAGDNDGTITGAIWSTGQVNGALDFDGSDDKVYVGDKESLDLPTLTLSYWAKLDNPSGSFQGGVAKGHIFGSPGGVSVKLSFHAGNATAAITNSSYQAYGVSTAIGDSDWHMWTMTVEDYDLCLYRDGELKNSTTYTGTIDYGKYGSYEDFIIGAAAGGYPPYTIDGKIDDVRVYNMALTAIETELLYANNYELHTYHLKAASPCINAGNPDGSYTDQNDIDGDSRVIGTEVDIGADEAFRVHNTTQDLYYTSIQPALDDACDVDYIEVYPATYYETVDFNGVNCTLSGTDPNDWDVVAATIIDANDPNDNAVTFDTSEDANSVIEGFTIKGGSSGVYIDGTSPKVRKCIIKGNGK